MLWLIFGLAGTIAFYYVSIEFMLAVKFPKLIAQVIGGFLTAIFFVACLEKLEVFGGIHYPEGYGDAIDEVRIENIIKALPVYDLEDFGPGFLVETEQGEQIYFAGQILENVVYIDEGDDVEEVVAETVIFEADHVSHEILKFTLEGKRIPAEIEGGVDLQELPLEDHYTGYEVLKPAADSLS